MKRPIRVSVIIPVLNEEISIAATLEQVHHLAPEEVIVVDGGSADRTRQIASLFPSTVVSSPRGRARQMNAGARVAKGDAFLFLHADTQLPLSALKDVRSALQDPECKGGRFDVKLSARRWAFRMIESLINLRSRWTKVATGDQAIFVRRSVFEEIGGFPEIPLMEDLAFSRALKKRGKIACLRSQVVTSSRRWETEGVSRTIIKMWLLRLFFLARVSPLFLKRFYRDIR